jgi:ABC-2 type transport system ATP-binding protein
VEVSVAIARRPAETPPSGRQARPAIEVRALTKRYRGGVVANDAIDLSIPEGVTVGVLGHNGAGKTTLIRQITGELRPTSGEVRVMGVDVLREHIHARAVMGVVPQDAEPYDHLHPDEHLRFFARLRGLSRRESDRRASEMLELLGLSTHTSKVARQLSGGLKRKLLVGNALIGDPPVLVLDEPTTGLDPHARREVWALLRELRGRGRTILMTTHYMDEAEQLCDEVALIAEGKLRLQGTVESLRGRCRNRYKATYGADGGRQIVFGQSSDDVARELVRRGIEEYVLSKTTLEDVYMELSGEPLEEMA